MVSFTDPYMLPLDREGLIEYFALCGCVSAENVMIIANIMFNQQNTRSPVTLLDKTNMGTHTPCFTQPDGSLSVAFDILERYCLFANNRTQFQTTEN